MTSQYQARMGDKRYAPLRPRYAGRLFAWLLITIFLLSGYGFFIAQVLPSPLGVALGEVAGAALAALGVFFELRWKPQRDRPPSWKTNPFFRAPLLALVAFMLGNIAFGAGLPALYSLGFGVNAAQSAVVTGWSVSRRHCSGPRLDGSFFLTPNPCMLHPVPRGTIVTLYGRQSPLGIAINSIAVKSAP